MLLDPFHREKLFTKKKFFCQSLLKAAIDPVKTIKPVVTESTVFVFSECLNNLKKTLLVSHCFKKLKMKTSNNDWLNNIVFLTTLH